MSAKRSRRRELKVTGNEPEGVESRRESIVEATTRKMKKMLTDGEMVYKVVGRETTHEMVGGETIHKMTGGEIHDIKSSQRAHARLPTRL